MKKLILSAIFCAVCVSVTAQDKSKKDKKGQKTFLDGQTFAVMQYEYKDEVRGKSVEDELEIKSGKIFSLLMYDKHNFEEMKYKIIKDSAYSEGEDSTKYIVFEAEGLNKSDETLKVEGVVDGTYIDGFMTVMAKGKTRKKYEFSGSVGKMRKK